MALATQMIQWGPRGSIIAFGATSLPKCKMQNAPGIFHPRGVLLLHGRTHAAKNMSSRDTAACPQAARAVTGLSNKKR